jgi:hypothetical protein
MSIYSSDLRWTCNAPLINHIYFSCLKQSLISILKVLVFQIELCHLQPKYRINYQTELNMPLIAFCGLIETNASPKVLTNPY